ncbi:MAG: energy transducer TonB [Xanthomonadales bacterium]|nr:energy transducer TonB [Xanthomonadales bacterium]
MMLKSNRYPAWAQDRFMLFLVLATGLHALLFFGVSFGLYLTPTPRLADTLDVVLVQWRSEETPEEADYLAQVDQVGGGETSDPSRPTEQHSGVLPTPERGEAPIRNEQQVPEVSLETREILAHENALDDPLQRTDVEQPEQELPTAAELMQQSMDMAALQTEVSRDRQWQSKLPRREFISANTRQYEFASYMSSWVAKVERVGNLNYPSELRRKNLHGDLVLTVGILQNGTIESIDVKRSSGMDEIDQAAVRIVRLAAPYAPLPENITESVDVLHITRPWRFESAFGLSQP